MVGWQPMIEITCGDSEMFKPADKSTPMNVSLWLISGCLVMFLALAGSPSSMAAPWADRAMARRTARAERTELRDRPRQTKPTDDAGTVSRQLPVLAPENALRPGVVRRLARRGISVEELEALTRGGQPQQFANGQTNAQSVNQYERQSRTHSVAGGQPDRYSKQTDLSPGLSVGTLTAETGRPLQAGDRGSKKSRSVLVDAEEPVSSDLDEGPRFPGMEEDKKKTNDAPVVTHEPIELLPTPKPNK
jgi:hypothetical protein